ncbi:unnamed protein product [Penicillium pancosmium]
MTSISFGQANSGFQVGLNQGSIYFQQGRILRIGKNHPIAQRAERADRGFLQTDQNVALSPYQRCRFRVIQTLLAEMKSWAKFMRRHRKRDLDSLSLVLAVLGQSNMVRRQKTQLAIEYCHQVRQQSPNTWIFWVHASNAARCEKCLRDLADRAKIPGRKDRNADIFQLVGNWLQDEKIGKWILILDNVDDDELLRRPSTTASGTKIQANTQNHHWTQPPLRCLLESSNGSIIITSRNKEVASYIVGHQRNIFDVQPMNRAEALALLKIKLDIYHDAESLDIAQLVDELELMPLAIVQAASYIIHHSPRFSVSQYLEELQKSDRQAITLLNYEAGHLHRDWEAKNSILLTWQISFNYIRKIRQSAADLLSLMSFFDRQGIPEDLLRVQDKERNHDNYSFTEGIVNRSSEEDMDMSSESDVDHEFEEDIRTLRDYSFISTTCEANTVFTIHRLVQLTARVWLTTHGQIEQWKEQFIRNLYREFPTGEYENWARCRQLFPHVKSAMSQCPNSHGSQQEWATLLYKGAWYSRELGNASDAREMASKSRKLGMMVFGLDGEEALRSTAMLARVHMLEGRWEEAEKLQVQVIATYKNKFGEAHPDTLSNLNSLGLTYWNWNRLEEAKELFLQVMEICKTNFEKDHPNTLASMGNLALVYDNQGQWDEAEKLEEQVMEARKTKLGEDHPDTLASMGNLAMTYWHQGRRKEAEQLQELVMDICKTKLGEDHYNTLTSMANLAITLESTGRRSEAISLLRTCVAKQQQILGPAHPYTVSNTDTLLVWETRDLATEE